MKNDYNLLLLVFIVFFDFNEFYVNCTKNRFSNVIMIYLNILLILL